MPSQNHLLLHPGNRSHAESGPSLSPLAGDPLEAGIFTVPALLLFTAIIAYSNTFGPRTTVVTPSDLLTLPSISIADSIKSALETREKFDPKRDAAKDIADAIIATKNDGKRILLDVGGEWYIWCHRLNKLFQDNAGLADCLRAKYVIVKINYSTENQNEKVLSQYPAIKGYPHLFVLNREGKLLHSQDTGELESGNHRDLDKVFSLLKKWAASSGS